MSDAPDPIQELVRALMDKRPPPLEWVVRHGADELDPLHAAWDTSTDPHAMAWVLTWLGHGRRCERVWGGTKRVVKINHGRTFPRRADYVAELRLAFPKPPGRLDDLLRKLVAP